MDRPTSRLGDGVPHPPALRVHEVPDTMRHVIVSTLLRGAVNPPEPLDAENQARLDAVEESEARFAEETEHVSRWRECYEARHGRKYA